MVCPPRIGVVAALLLLLVYACAASAQEATVVCTDAGVQLRMRRSAAMPLEELSELHTGKSCATTTVMRLIADDAAILLDQAALDVIDCVTTRIDEDYLTLFAVLRLCNRPSDAVAMTVTAWDAYLRPKLQSIFGAPTGRSDGLEYHRSRVESDHLSVPPSYMLRSSPTAKGGSEDAPRFRYKATELWSVRGNTNAESSIVLLRLKLKNDGTAPLHVFAAAVKLMREEPSNGVLTLLPQKVEAVMPSTEVSVLFQLEMPNVVELPDEAECLVYFAHTSSRAHILEGRLDGKKLKITNDIKKKSPAKAQADLFSGRKIGDTSSLESTYTSLPFGVWQLVSMGIVVVVGAATTLYMRRKWTRVHWSQWLDCLTTKKLMHKTSKMTEMTSKQPAYEPDGSFDADMDALESEGFLPTSAMEAALPPRKKTITKLREKMPAITMQWKKPEIFRNTLSGRRTLKLDRSARLDPKRFENLWEEFIQRHNVTFHAAKRPTVEAIVRSMGVVGISCMASGTVNGVEKYVLYAKQSDSSDFFFVAVDILVASNETTLSIRTSKDTKESLVEEFIALVDKEVATLLK